MGRKTPPTSVLASDRVEDFLQKCGQVMRMKTGGAVQAMWTIVLPEVQDADLALVEDEASARVVGLNMVMSR